MQTTKTTTGDPVKSLSKCKGKIVSVLGKKMLRTDKGIPVPYNTDHDEKLQIEAGDEVWYTPVKMNLMGIAVVKNLMLGTLSERMDSIKVAGGENFSCSPKEDFIERFNIKGGDTVEFTHVPGSKKALCITPIAK